MSTKVHSYIEFAALTVAIYLRGCAIIEEGIRDKAKGISRKSAFGGPSARIWQIVKNKFLLEIAQIDLRVCAKKRTT